MKVIVSMYNTTTSRVERYLVEVDTVDMLERNLDLLRQGGFTDISWEAENE